MAPEYEALRQQQAGNQGQLAGLIGQNLGSFDAGQIDLSQAPQLPNVVDYSSLGEMPTVGGYNDQVISTMRALQNPGLAQQRAAKEAQLAAMGLGTGSGSAWNAEQGNLADAENRADLNAILAGINQGNTEFGQGMQRYQQGATNLNNQFGQGLQLNQLGTANILNQNSANLQKLQGLMGLGRDVTNPQFASFMTPGMGANTTPDLTGAASNTYQAQLDAANAKNAGGIGGFLAPIAGAIGTGIGGPIGGAIGGAAGNFVSGLFK